MTNISLKKSVPNIFKDPDKQIFCKTKILYDIYLLCTFWPLGGAYRVLSHLKYFRPSFINRHSCHKNLVTANIIKEIWMCAIGLVLLFCLMFYAKL